MLDWVMNFLFPKTCVATKQEGEYLSKEGRKQLFPHPEICPASHRFSRDFRTLPGYKQDFFLTGIHICFYYGSYLKKLILKLKYYHQKDVVDTLLDRMILSIQTNKSLWSAIQKDNVCLTYVPSHWWRKYIQKGYNQSEILAERLAQKLMLPCITIAKKTKHTRSQTTLSRKNRLQNMRGSFELIGHNNRHIYDTVIVIDDITTTGATLNELAKTIYQYDNKKQLWGLVIGRHNN